MCQPFKKQHGFSLVELVAVIVLLGIISVGVSSYIRTSMEAYREVTRRDDIAQMGRFAVERISREVKSALPGSVRRGSSGGIECLEFVPVLGSSVYIEAPFTAASTALSVVDFPQATAVANRRVAIYTINNSDVYNQPAGASYVAAISGNLSNAVNGERTLTLTASNRFPRESSVAQRIYFVDSPVSFCLDTTTNELRRYQAYGYNSAQMMPPTGSTNSLLAERMSAEAGQAFAYSTTVQQPNGLVSLDFTLTALGANDETVRFVHDIALVNAQ